MLVKIKSHMMAIVFQTECKTHNQFVDTLPVKIIPSPSKYTSMIHNFLLFEIVHMLIEYCNELGKDEYNSWCQIKTRLELTALTLNLIYCRLDHLMQQYW